MKMETFTLDEFSSMISRAQSAVDSLQEMRLPKEGVRQEFEHLYLFLRWVGIHKKDVLLEYLKYHEGQAEMYNDFMTNGVK